MSLKIKGVYMNKLLVGVSLLFSVNLYADIKIENCMLLDSKTDKHTTLNQVIDLIKIVKTEFKEDRIFHTTSIKLYIDSSVDYLYMYEASNTANTQDDVTKLLNTTKIYNAAERCMKK